MTSGGRFASPHEHGAGVAGVAGGAGRVAEAGREGGGGARGLTPAWLRLLLRIRRDEGLRGLFRGITINYIRVVPMVPPPLVLCGHAASLTPY
jgi:hypothetical protein